MQFDCKINTTYIHDVRNIRAKVCAVCMQHFRQGPVVSIIVLCIAAVAQKLDFYQMCLCGVSSAIACVPLTIRMVGLDANSIQFGMEQLTDFPSEDQSIFFIPWQVWIWFH